MIIRPWEPRDGAKPAEIVKAVFEEYGFAWDEGDYCADLYDVQKHYLDEGSLFWLAEVDGEPQGTAALEFFPEVMSESHDGRTRIKGATCSLERLYVHPNARKMGLGGALFRTTIKEAKKRGHQVMEIWSDKLLLDAHRLYQKLGAVVEAERLCDDPDESPEWGLRLDLAKTEV